MSGETFYPSSFKEIPSFCTCFALRITSIVYNIATLMVAVNFTSRLKKKVKKAPYIVQIILIAVLITLPASMGLGLKHAAVPLRKMTTWSQNCPLL